MNTDLSGQYLGLKLANPLVISACPLTGNVDDLKRLEQSGAAAVVLPSLFEEQIEHEEMQMHELQEFGTDSFAEALSYFPEPADYRTGPQQYLELIGQAKQAVSIPVIASLNGTTTGGWTRYARMMQDAGADALELNIYYVAADTQTSAQDVEQRFVDLVAAVKQSVSLPVAVKLGPYFSAVANFAHRLVEAGADGLVLFNRFLQPDIDLRELQTVPRLVLSSPDELLLPLRWTAILYGRIKASLAITSGIHNVPALVKALLVGADVAMVASVLYRQGYGVLGQLLDGLRDWMAQHEYQSLGQLRGSMSQQHCPDPAAFERGNYMKALTTFVGKPI